MGTSDLLDFKSFLREDGRRIKGFADERRISNKYREQLARDGKLTISFSNLLEYYSPTDILKSYGYDEIIEAMIKAVYSLWKLPVIEIKII